MEARHLNDRIIRTFAVAGASEKGFTITQSFLKAAEGIETMHDIVTTRKMENGVACYYGESGKEKFESFTYRELIDIKINALDLLDDPRNYAVDTEKHTLVMKK